MPFGYLRSEPGLPRDHTCFGIHLRPDLATRFEEFAFARDALAQREPGLLLDAACGFEPNVHIFPQVAAEMGWKVEALDLEDPWPGFPDDFRINRVKGSVIGLPYQDGQFDAVTCISAVEHMSEEVQQKAFVEFHRVLKPDGRLILTIDLISPRCYAVTYGSLFDFGDEISLWGQHLTPAVAYLVGTKR